MKQARDHLETATFAGGCFWCLESDLEKHPGVKEAISGYTGGHKKNPTYAEVSSGMSGHLEAIQVRFDPDVLPYEALLDIFWRHVDPTDPGGQFVDRGSQYRTAIFFQNQEQKNMAEASRQALARSKRFKKPIATEILPACKFYPAESYHQEYHKRNPIRYKFYRHNSGRDQFLKKMWSEKKATDDDLQVETKRRFGRSTSG